MTLKKQTLRKDSVVFMNEVLAEKDELIALSETWSEREEMLFRKMLKQGGKFSIQGNKFRVERSQQVVNSKGEKDGGIVTVPGLDGGF